MKNKKIKKIEIEEVFVARSKAKSKISKNLMWYYNNISMNDDTVFDLSNFSVNKLRFYYGTLLGLSHDSVVPLADMYGILDSADSDDKNYWCDSKGLKLIHTNIKNNEEVKALIKEELSE